MIKLIMPDGISVTSMINQTTTHGNFHCYTPTCGIGKLVLKWVGTDYAILMTCLTQSAGSTGRNSCNTGR